MYGMTNRIQKRGKMFLITAALLVIVIAAGGIIWCAVQKAESNGRKHLKETAINPPLEEQGEAFQQWYRQQMQEDHDDNELCLVAPDTGEVFLIDLDSERQSTIDYMQGEALCVSGRTNSERGIFDGSVDLGESEIYLVNLSTMAYRPLEKSLRSALLDDYYVACWYAEEQLRMELVVFFCPEK